MLTPAPEASLQRRRLIWANAGRVAALTWLLLVLSTGLWFGAAILLARLWPAASAGASVLAGIGTGSLLLQLIGWSRRSRLHRLPGMNPSVNRQLFRELAAEQDWPLLADEPAYLVIERPGTWYASALQLTVLLQGRDAWLHVIGRTRFGSLHLLAWSRSKRLREQVQDVYARKLSRLERKQTGDDDDELPTQ